jgi:cell division protein FtsB
LAARDEASRFEPGAARRLLLSATVVGLIALGVGAVFGDRGLLTLNRKQHQVQGLRQEIDALREENARLATEIAALRSSPRAVERLAREELGLARADEVVFLLRRPDAAGRR